MVVIQIDNWNRYSIIIDQKKIFISKRYKQNSSIRKSILALHKNIAKLKRVTLQDNKFTVKSANGKVIIDTVPNTNSYQQYNLLKEYLMSESASFIDTDGERVYLNRV